MGDYVKVKDVVDGSERIEQGPKLLFLGAYEQVTKKGQGISLTATEYVRVENKLSGETSVVKGPCVWFPGAQEEGQKAAGISLSNTEYVLIDDKKRHRREVGLA